MLKFIIGLMVGGFIGVVLICAFQVGSRSDRDE